MNAYILRHYDDHQKRDVTIEVSGESARDVVLAHFRAMFPKASAPASPTARHQRDADPAVRDNAHLQADRAGHIGWAAHRADAEALAYLRTCPPPASRDDALAAAGYSR